MEWSPAAITIVMLVLSTTVSGLLGFLIYLFRRTAFNERELMQHKLEAAEKYAHKNEINELANHVERKIEDLFKQLYETR